MVIVVVVVVICRVDSVVVDGVNGVDVVIFGSSISGGNCASFGRFPHQ